MHPVDFVGGAIRGRFVCHIYNVVRNMDDLEERQARLAAALEHSAELMQRTEELLAEPRAEVIWTPPRQIRTHDAQRIEHDLNRRLTAIEVRLSERMDAIESRQTEISN